MTFTRSVLLPVVVLIAIAIVACGAPKNPPRTLQGIFVHPGNATAYSSSNESQVKYSVVAGYVGGGDVPLTSGVEWEVVGYWTSFDVSSTTVTCKSPAPYDNFLFPTAATVKATAALEGKTYSDTALLYCL